jgi:hypothetical protein
LVNDHHVPSGKPQRQELGGDDRAVSPSPPLYGPAGLDKIINRVVRVCGADRLSFTLEIHEGEGKLPLADAAPLFSHWRDTGNAERMNQWLCALAHNQQLVVASANRGLGRL